MCYSQIAHNEFRSLFSRLEFFKILTLRALQLARFIYICSISHRNDRVLNLWWKRRKEMGRKYFVRFFMWQHHNKEKKKHVIIQSRAAVFMAAAARLWSVDNQKSLAKWKVSVTCDVWRCIVHFGFFSRCSLFTVHYFFPLLTLCENLANWIPCWPAVMAGSRVIRYNVM